MNYELLGLFIFFLLYWYFNVRKQNYISANVPIEKMSNVSIFEG